MFVILSKPQTRKIFHLTLVPWRWWMVMCFVWKWYNVVCAVARRNQAHGVTIKVMRARRISASSNSPPPPNMYVTTYHSCLLTPTHLLRSQVLEVVVFTEIQPTVERVVHFPVVTKLYLLCRLDVLTPPYRVNNGVPAGGSYWDGTRNRIAGGTRRCTITTDCKQTMCR